MTFKKLLSLLLIFTIWISFLAPFAKADLKFSPAKSQTDEEEGLKFRLREASPENKGNPAQPKSAPIENLSEAETNAILRRLPELQTVSADKTDFKLRPNSLPPPKTGNMIPVKFPAEEKSAPPKVENSAELKVLRFAPAGDVSLATELSVTFSQPMVAVTSQTEAAQNVPVVLTPEVKGKWRWLGTNTLIFDAAERFPMATRFTAQIPAETKSATGGKLSKEVSWNFSTAAPKVEKFLPGDEILRRDALFLAAFNQQINPADVLKKISLISGKQTFPLRLATESEIAADEKLTEALKTLSPKRFIAFRAAEILPADSDFSLNFESGLPSAEGSLTSVAPQSFSFKTFGELKLVKADCGYDEDKKEFFSYEPCHLEFNNQLDEKSFEQSLVKIEPAIENAQISVNWRQINIEGLKKPRTTYKITISPALKDEFGQTLGRETIAELRIGADEPSLYHDGGNKNPLVLDPFSKPIYSIYSTNYQSLSVKLYAVKPEDFRAFQAFKEADAAYPPNFGKLVLDKQLKINSKPDEQMETQISLLPALEKGFGHAVLMVEAPIVSSKTEREKIAVWISVTQIGLDAFADYEQLGVLASDLKTGKPLSGVQLSLLNGAVGATASDGTATLDFSASGDNRNGLLIARSGADSAILPEDKYFRAETDWKRKTQKDNLRWFVFNDRNMYRPGETVSIKGYLRKITGGKFADIAELQDAAKNLKYALKDSQGNEVLKGNAEINAFGAFDFKLNLPENLNLGEQDLKLAAESLLEGKEFTHNFQVQEFRRPEFEVSAKVESAAPFYLGDSATLAAEAKYYSGGFLSDAETNWSVSSIPTNYTPPNREDFTFGKFQAWWSDTYESDSEARTSEEFKGATDKDGKHRLAIDFLSANPARPYLISAEASVQDVNRQTFAASTTLLVHPSELYVGIRSPKTFVEKGERFRVETITTDVDGKAVAGAPVSVTAELKDWQQIKGEWQEVTIETQNCQIKSAVEAVSCDFIAKQGGVFSIKASVFDTRERRNESELTIWAAGGHTEPARDVEQENVELIPDKKEYAPGETAKILVNAPFFPAEGILTLRRNGIVKTERFALSEKSTVLKIAVEERFLPNVYAQIDLIGAAPRVVYEDERDAKLPPRPAFASGGINLEISTASRRLNVSAEPAQKTLEPGGATTVNVSVTDSAGNAVKNSEVAIVAADESILALTDYEISNPLDVFYRQFSQGASDYHSRENVVLANPDDINIGFGSGSGDGNGMGDGNRDPFSKPVTFDTRQTATVDVTASANGRGSGYGLEQIKVRSNFNPLAIFSPSVLTDENGKAQVQLNLPDNLTRYRITAVAATKSRQFGKSESNVTARQPLIVRPSAPRFMNFGDRAELPVVLQNQTDEPLAVEVAIRAANADFIAGNGRKVIIAANDRAEVRFPVSSQKAGIARFQIGAVAGKFSDAAEIAFPVYTPATTENFAVYGTTEENGAISQTVQMPADVFTEFGGLEITTSSTQLQELTDAFIYLQNYPFECTEQISSRILSVAALRDVLTAFDAKDLPAPDVIQRKMVADIDRLFELQHADGGFSFWRKDDESIPFVSVHVAHALARAKAKNYWVMPDRIEPALNYLKNIETKYLNFYSAEERAAISAYALYVRDLLGDKDAAKARKLLANSAETLSPEALGWLLSVLADEPNSVAEVEHLKRELLNRVTETAAAAHFVSAYKDGEYVLLSSERRADGVILEAFLKAEPGNDLIPKIVRGLLANKVRGRWKNTQENVFVLLALDKYFQTYEKATPNFVARIWLGDAFAGEQNFAGRTVNSNQLNVPMNFLARQPNNFANLILDKQGAGRLYYRIGLKYAPKNLKSEAADFGFAVSRTYEAVDNPADVRQNPDGSWTIKAGARVKVNVQMLVPTRRYHVALVDKLPAGFEIINSALAVSETLPKYDRGKRTSEAGFDYRFDWFEHQNLRDERAEAFKTLLPEGVWSYSYTARATTPGEFVAPPAKAEEMYSPETFGRSRTDVIKIE